MPTVLEVAPTTFTPPSPTPTLTSTPPASDGDPFHGNANGNVSTNSNANVNVPSRPPAATVTKSSSIQNLKHKLSTTSLFRRKSSSGSQQQQQQGVVEEVFANTPERGEAKQQSCSCSAPCLCDTLSEGLTKMALGVHVVEVENSEDGDGRIDEEDGAFGERREQRQAHEIASLAEGQNDKLGHSHHTETIDESFTHFLESALEEAAAKGGMEKPTDLGLGGGGSSENGENLQVLVDEIGDDEREAPKRSVRAQSMYYDENCLPPGHYLKHLVKKEPSLAISSASVAASSFTPSRRPASMTFPTRPPSISSISTISSTCPHYLPTHLPTPGSRLNRGSNGSSASNPSTPRRSAYSRADSTTSLLSGSTLSLSSLRSTATGGGARRGSLCSRPSTPNGGGSTSAYSCSDAGSISNGGSPSGTGLATPNGAFEREYVSFPTFRKNSDRNGLILGDMGRWVGGMGRRLSRKLVGGGGGGDRVDEERSEEEERHVAVAKALPKKPPVPPATPGTEPWTGSVVGGSGGGLGNGIGMKRMKRRSVRLGDALGEMGRGD